MPVFKILLIFVMMIMMFFYIEFIYGMNVPCFYVVTSSLFTTDICLPRAAWYFKSNNAGIIEKYTSECKF